MKHPRWDVLKQRNPLWAAVPDVAQAAVRHNRREPMWVSNSQMPFSYATQAQACQIDTRWINRMMVHHIIKQVDQAILTWSGFLQSPSG